MRAMSNKDVATGIVSTADNETYSSTGPPSIRQVRDDAPESPAPTCYVWALRSSRAKDQKAAVLNGTALVRDWILIDDKTATLGDGRWEYQWW